jgi:hypothetical protein
MWLELIAQIHNLVACMLRSYGVHYQRAELEVPLCGDRQEAKRNKSSSRDYARPAMSSSSANQYLGVCLRLEP